MLRTSLFRINVGLGFAQGSDLTPACLIALASVRILKH